MINKITYSNNYSRFPHFNDSHPDDPYMLNGLFTEEYMKKCIENGEEISRASENVTPLYLVYENDNLSFEEQLKIIDSLDHSYIRYITFSGHKSYHVLFKIKVPEDITKEEYKKAWTAVMKKLNILQYADTQVGSLSRLTRNPNGFNSEYNCRQTCIYDNPECESINLIPFITKIRDNELKQAWKNAAFKNLSDKQETNQTPEEVISRLRNTSLKAYEGYQMWQTGDFPKGYQYLSPAKGMYNICIQAGCDENETLEFCRAFLQAAKEAHPSNVRVNIKNWNPRRH